MSAERARDQEAGDAQGGEPGAERAGEGEPGTGERLQQAAPGGGTQPGGLLGREAEVTRPDRGRQGWQGRGNGAQVAVEDGAVGTGGDLGPGGLEVNAGRITRGIGGDEEQVVVGVAGWWGRAA